MMMIVTIHYWLFCFPLEDLTPFSFEWCYGSVLKGGAQCSVNVYVLISAYFLCNATFKTKRLLSVASQVIFYSVAIYITLISLGLIKFSILDFRVFMPVLFREYWFVTEYVGLLLLSPFINKCLSSLDKKQFTKLVITIVSLFVIYQSLFFLGGGLTLGRGMDIVWFVCLYIIGSFIRKHIDIEYVTALMKKYWYITIVVLLLPPIWGIIAGGISQLYLGNRMIVDDLWVYNSMLVVPSSIILFINALRVQVRDRFIKILTLFGKSSFAVYLITDNRNLRYILWDFVRDNTSIDSYHIIWQYIATIISLYIICTAIDLFVRMPLFSLYRMPQIISLKLFKIDNWFNK